MPRRVLIVVNDAAFFLSHRLPLALGAQAAGYEVHVATPPSDAALRITAAGLAFHPLRLARASTAPGAELAALWSIVELYRRLRPDLVHHVTAKPILYGGVAALAARVPAVVHAVSGLGYVFIATDLRARALRRAVMLAYRVATSHPRCAVIFQNDDDRAVFGAAIRTSRVELIPGSGVDLGEFRREPLPDGVPLVVLPARMLWDKGVGELVEAARRVAGAGVAARFALVGGVDRENPAGIAREQLEAWAREGSVEWWGSRSDMPRVLAQAAIVCLPSYREGTPKALLEACAVGRAIVTTDVPGCRDVVREAGGVLVPPRDAPALGRALLELLVDRARLAALGSQAAAAAAHFSVERVVARTLEVYRALLEPGADPAGALRKARRAPREGSP